ncbi:MAG: hypothetical protein R3Y68_09000 [Rikenellaceae bacterium]
MSYIARAIIRVVDKRERLRLFDAASGGRLRAPFRGEDDEYIAIDDSVIALRDEELAVYFRGVMYIDCNAYTPNGTEEEAMKLFLELAQMRDDAGSDAKWLICDCPHYAYMYAKTFEREEIVDGRRYKRTDRDLFSSATPLEVAQAFKEGRIEL